jgi:WD40 repeat protein
MKFEHGGPDEMGGVLCVAFDLEGKRLATGDGEERARIFDVETGEEPVEVKTDGFGAVHSVAWDPTGAARLATGREDNYARIVDTTTGEQIQKLEHIEEVLSVAWNSTGTYLATGCKDNSAYIFDVETGEQLRKLMTQGEEVKTVAWDAAGARLALTSDNNAILFDVTNGKEVLKLAHKEMVYAVAWDVAGTRLATACGGGLDDSASNDNMAFIFNLANGQEVKKFAHTDAAAQQANSAGKNPAASPGALQRGPSFQKYDILCVAWDVEGKRIATGGTKFARIFDVATGEEKRFEHGGNVESVAWDPAGTRLATCCDSDIDSIRIIDVAANKIASKATLPAKPEFVAWDKTGTRLAACCSDGKTLVFNVKIGEALQVEAPLLQVDGVRAAWEKADKHLAVVSAEFVRVYDVENGSTVLNTKLELGQKHRILSMAWNETFASCATGGVDGTARIFDVKTGQVFLKLRHGGEVNSVKWSPAGTRLCTGCEDRVVRVFDATGEVVWKLEMETEVFSVAWDAGGAHIVTGGVSPASGENYARVYEWGSGALRWPAGALGPYSVHLVLYDQIAAVATAALKGKRYYQQKLLGALKTVLKTSSSDVVLRDPFWGLTVIDMILLLRDVEVWGETDSADVVCEVLDLLLPKVVAEMKKEPRLSSACHKSVGNTLGWLVNEGKAAALQTTKIPDILDALVVEHAPEELGFRSHATQPRLADNCTPFRATGSPVPLLQTQEEMDLVLPRATVGASSIAQLQVLLIGGLFNADTCFFQGLCETPQADEAALFAHPVVKAGVLVKWEQYAHKRFFALFLGYVCFLVLFTIWSVAESAHDIDGTPLLNVLRIATAGFAAFFMALEIKQSLHLGLTTHLEDPWNFLAAFAYVGTFSNALFFEHSQSFRSALAISIWILLLGYLRGFPRYAPYVQMLAAIIVDLQGFLPVYVVIILAFAHAMLMFSDTIAHMSLIECIEEMVREALSTYRMGTLGDFDPSRFESHWQMYLLFFACTVMITVILLNVLIAVISDTFDRLQEHSESSSVKSRAQLIADVESIFGTWDPPAYLVFSNIVDEGNASEGGKIGALKTTIDNSQTKITEAVKTEVTAQLRLELEKLKHDMKLSEATILTKLDSLVSDGPRPRAISGGTAQGTPGGPGPGGKMNFLGKQLTKLR